LNRSVLLAVGNVLLPPDVRTNPETYFWSYRALKGIYIECERPAAYKIYIKRLWQDLLPTPIPKTELLDLGI